MAFIDSGIEGIPLREIIEKLGNKNYECISVRCKWTDKGQDYDEYCGDCKYIDGKLIPLDGDSYSIEDLYFEWEEKEENGVNRLVVWEKGVVVKDWEHILKVNGLN